MIGASVSCTFGYMRSLLLTAPNVLNFAVWLNLLTQISSAIVEYDFDVAWIWTSPTGLPARQLIGVNGQWPPPTVHAGVGDNVLVRVSNLLGNQSTSIHFHGLFMNGTANMDGTSHISQCSILPGESFVYNFTVNQPGTYWYHSHEMSQYPDGLRGALIVQDDGSPYKAEYDEQIVLTLSDWYNNPVATLLQKNYDDPSAARSLHDPVPDGNLINDSSESEMYVKPDTTYMVRIVNIGAFAAQYLWFDEHNVTIIEVDGVYVEPIHTNMLHIASGQRYAVLLEMKRNGTGRYAVTSRVDKGSFSTHETWPSDLDATAWLVYDDTLAQRETHSNPQLTSVNDMLLVPLDHQPLLSNPDNSIHVVIDMKKHSDKLTHWQFDTAPFEFPDTPLLHTVLSSTQNATQSDIYPPRTPTITLPHNAVIELVIRNKHMRKHPMHLHGHTFQIINRTKTSQISPTNPEIPPRRDTVVIEAVETMTVRFRADNPGVWLFHCHMEWHAHSGLVLAIVEAPEVLQRQHGMEDLEERLRVTGGKVCASVPSDQEQTEQMNQIEGADPALDGNTSSTNLSSSGLTPALFLLIILAVLFTGYALGSQFWPLAKRHDYVSVEQDNEE